MKNGKGKKMLSEHTIKEIKMVAREDAERGVYSRAYYRCFPFDLQQAYMVYDQEHKKAKRGFGDDRDYEHGKI